MWQPTCQELGISHRHSPEQRTELKNITLWPMIKGSLFLYISSQMIPKSTKLSLCFLNIMDSWCPARHQGCFLEPGLRLHREINFLRDSRITGRILSKSCIFREVGQPIPFLLFQEHLLRCSRVVSVPLLQSKGLWSCNPRIKMLALLLPFVLSSLFTDTLAQFT